MADYKELLRRAVEALPENNEAARRAVYEQARRALIGQLRSINPPLPARDITTHRLQLEDCIRQVEAQNENRAGSTTAPPPKFARVAAKQTSDVSLPPTKLESDNAKSLAPTKQTNQTIRPWKPSMVSVATLPPHDQARTAQTQADDLITELGNLMGSTSVLTVPSQRPIRIPGMDEIVAPAAKPVPPPTRPTLKSVTTTKIDPPKPSKDGYFVHPKVFKTPQVELELDYVSVMMPFHSDFDAVYRNIAAAAKSAGLRVERADQVWEDQIIIEDVFAMIFRSSVVVCDFSGRNPNVMYEAGIAHTLGRTVVPIAQNPAADLPFDIRHHRALRYANTRTGLKKLKETLRGRLESLTPDVPRNAKDSE